MDTGRLVGGVAVRAAQRCVAAVRLCVAAAPLIAAAPLCAPTVHLHAPGRSVPTMVGVLDRSTLLLLMSGCLTLAFDVLYIHT